MTAVCSKIDSDQGSVTETVTASKRSKNAACRRNPAPLVETSVDTRLSCCRASNYITVDEITLILSNIALFDIRVQI